MTTLFDVCKDALYRVGALTVNNATGGSTTTTVDSDLGGSDDDFNGGMLLIIRDSAGASAAPEGEFAEVSDYASGTGTITHGTLTAAVASGDTYGVTGPDYRHHETIQAVNMALSDVGDIPKVDTTTLDTASGQTEYTAQTAWKRGAGPLRIDIQGITTDANDNEWYTVHDWEYIPASAGSTGLIVFRKQPVSSRDARVWYMGPHDAVYSATDNIYEGVDDELLIWTTIYYLLLPKMGRNTSFPDNMTQLLKNAEEKRDMLMKSSRTWRPPRHRKLMIVGQSSREEDQFNYPDPS